jgi:uncharacterized protein DUF4386
VALFLAIAITAFPILRPQGQGIAIWLIAAAVVSLAVAAVEQTGVMSMVSLSEAFSKATPADRDQLRTLSLGVSAARQWGHYLGRIADGWVLFALYTAMYRASAVPRALAGFGIVAVILQLTALVMPFVGHDVLFPMLAPVGVSQLVLAFWLIIKGFHDQGSPSPGPV